MVDIEQSDITIPFYIYILAVSISFNIKYFKILINHIFNEIQ